MYTIGYKFVTGVTPNLDTRSCRRHALFTERYGVRDPKDFPFWLLKGNEVLEVIEYHKPSCSVRVIINDVIGWLTSVETVDIINGYPWGSTVSGRRGIVKAKDDRGWYLVDTGNITRWYELKDFVTPPKPSNKPYIY